MHQTEQPKPASFEELEAPEGPPGIAACDTDGCPEQGVLKALPVMTDLVQCAACMQFTQNVRVVSAADE